MKRVSATLFILIVILAMASTASAQSTPMRANIPFDFTVGDRHLDKGDYRVRVTTLGGSCNYRVRTDQPHFPCCRRHRRKILRPEARSCSGVTAMPTSFPRSFGQMAWRGSCRKPEAKLRSPESIQALRQSRRPPQGKLCLLNWDFGS